MRLQVIAGGHARAIAVSIDDPEATIADLSQGLFLDPGAALVVDGVVHLPDTCLHDVALVDGAFVTSLNDHETRRSGLGKTWIGIVGGTNAGAVRRTDSVGTIAIGRDPLNDLVVANSSVSSSHVVVELDESGISVTDLQSLNGTWVGQKAIKKTTALAFEAPFRMGSSTAVARVVRQDDRPMGTSAQHRDAVGKILLNRPPRRLILGAPKAIELPDQPAERMNPTLTVVSLLVPIMFAAAMVLMLGSWRYALFGLLSPVMALGNWFSSRRRVRRERDGDITTHREALQRLRKQLAAAAAVERERRAAIGPDLLEVRRRVELPSSLLWERRLDSDDAMLVRLGVGESQWAPETVFSDDVVPEDVLALVADSSGLTDVELFVDLRRGPLGLVGDAARGAAASRALMLQLSAHHGPADCQLVVFTTPERLEEWRWAKWLPHTAMANEGVRILVGEASSTMAVSLLEAVEPDASASMQCSSGYVLIVDDIELIHKRSSPVRRLLECAEQNVFGVVLTSSVDQLPASVASIVEVEPSDGRFALSFPAVPGLPETGVLDSVSVVVAEDIACSLARFGDPEQVVYGGGIPSVAGAIDVFGELDSLAVQKRWMLSKRGSALIAPLGLGDSGRFGVDLVADGPHGLVAGTTGAGKSELLRTLIMGLATNHDPDDLVFVLIDYKGGSAFDRCAQLPHVVGMVTDLDDHLAERALLSLEAELHHRERVLRDAEVTDVIGYREEGSRGGPLPRLVVVIDEFATLRSELPEFVSSLVGIAQRGRSLGVHLVLATQRPSGAVDANIRANTNLRIALRVQDDADSADVIGASLASGIPRTAPGRAYVRRGEGDLVGVQTAYLSGNGGVSGPPLRTAEVPVGSGYGPQFSSEVRNGEATVLDSLVDVVIRAGRNHCSPRRPWLDALPRSIDTSGETLWGYERGDDADVVLAVGDDPSQQRRTLLGWNTAQGHLAVVGVLGSGVTTTIRSTIARLSEMPDRAVWVFPVDHGAGGLAGIDRYGHVANVIDSTDEARQARLLQFLAQELDGRRHSASGSAIDEPLIVVAVDGIGSFAESNDLSSGTVNGDLWARLGRDGPAVGIVCVVGATSLSAIPRSMRGSISQFVVHEQQDRNGYADFGIRTKALPVFSPGRALWGTGAVVAQVCDWETSLPADRARVGPKVPVIEELPEQVDASVLGGVETLLDPGLSVPVGVDGATRLITRLTIRAGEHGTVSGPSRSGRTSALRLIAGRLRAADPALILVGLAPTASASLFDVGVFDAGGTVEDLDHVLTMALDDGRRWVLLVDDADRIDVDSGPLLDLAKNAPDNVTMVVALRSAAARQNYGHWTRAVRASGAGILLQPDNSVDGDLLAVRLPRNERLAAVPGRGYLVVDGEAHTVQLAHP